MSQSSALRGSLFDWLRLGSRFAASPLGAAGKLQRFVIGSGLTLLFTGTVLAMMDLALEIQVEPTTRMSDFLSGDQQSAMVVGVWHHEGLLWLALTYLGIDTLLLIPGYVVFGLALAIQLDRELALDSNSRFLQGVALISVVLTVLLALVDVTENIAGMRYLSGMWSDAGLRFIGSVFRTKQLLGGAMFASLGILLACWYFNVVGRQERDQQKQRSYERSKMRFAVADILWRTRYIVALLMAFAALTIVMDQSRDVLVGLAHLWEEKRGIALSVSIVVTLVGILFLSYVSWAWARIMLRATRQTGEVVIKPSEEQQSAVSDRAPDTPDTYKWPEGSYLVARWWARILGTGPLFIVAWLSALAMRDALRIGAGSTALLLAVSSAVLLVAALARLALDHLYSKTALMEYYDDRTSRRTGFQQEIIQAKYAVFRMKRAPVWIPLVALFAFVLLRGLSLWENDPARSAAATPLALAIISFALTFWAGTIGWLAQLALRQLVPWVLFLVLLFGLLGLIGATDNHVVRYASVGAVPAANAGLWGMYWAQVVAAGFVGLGWFGIWWYGKSRTGVVIAAIGIVGTIATPFVAERFLQPARMAEPSLQPRLPLDQAMVNWLERVCAANPDCGSGRKAEKYPVYFISSEGGGIRAAYWTAIVLARLSINDRFVERTFSLSGVSGGSVGLAAWRACLDTVKARPHGNELASEIDRCVDRLGATDLLSPLLSAWMLEDALARIVPASLCRMPGCGFLDRGTWFEAAMERAVPALNAALAPQPRESAHFPHLLLNSTWVETGERAIASDVLIDWRYFPTARDQVSMLGASPALSTAAHNSARFPFVNAIGAVRPYDCDADVEPERCGKDWLGNVPVAGHLADGGYFDNAGAHTTADVLRAFELCLWQKRGLCADLAKPEWRTRVNWLRSHLVPTVIKLRNGVESDVVRPPQKGQLGLGELCKQPDPKQAAAVPDEEYPDVAMPRCIGRWALYSDTTGPAVAAANALGTGANGRLAEANLTGEVIRVRRGLRPAEPDDAKPAVIPIDLVKDRILYPLGWYLSKTARDGMRKQLDDLPPL